MDAAGPAHALVEHVASSGSPRLADLQPFGGPPPRKEVASSALLRQPRHRQRPVPTSRHARCRPRPTAPSTPATITSGAKPTTGSSSSRPSGEFKASATSNGSSAPKYLRPARHRRRPRPRTLLHVEGCSRRRNWRPAKKPAPFMTANRSSSTRPKPKPETGPRQDAADDLAADRRQPALLPASIAVDPSNHDLVLLAENAEHQIVQRFSSTGTTEDRFIDTTDTAEARHARRRPSRLPGRRPRRRLLHADRRITPGINATRAWQLPPTLDSSERCGLRRRGGKRGLAAGARRHVESFYGGPQLAISSDGRTLYWKEAFKKSAEKEAGELLPGLTP